MRKKEEREGQIINNVVYIINNVFRVIHLSNTSKSSKNCRHRNIMIIIIIKTESNVKQEEHKLQMDNILIMRHF